MEKYKKDDKSDDDNEDDDGDNDENMTIVSMLELKLNTNPIDRWIFI